jgi:hypothetical protein
MSAMPILWLYGLPGVGKSALAHAVTESLRQSGQSVTYLDEAALRSGLGNDLAKSLEDTAELERRAAELAVLLAEQGQLVVVAACSPIEQQRKRIRRVLSAGSYHMVQVVSDAAVAKKRSQHPMREQLLEAWEQPADPLLVENHSELPSTSLRLQQLLATGQLPASVAASPAEVKRGFQQNWVVRERDQREQMLSLSPSERERVLARPRNPAERMYGKDAAALPWYYSITLMGWSPQSLAMVGVAMVGMIGVTIYGVRLLLKEERNQELAAILEGKAPDEQIATSSREVKATTQVLLQDLIQEPDAAKLQEKGLAPKPTVPQLSSSDRNAQLEIARNVLSGYTTAQTVEEKLKWVRDPERVKPLMQAFYQEGKDPAGYTIGLVQTFTDSAQLWVECVPPANSAVSGDVFWMAEAGGELKLDWESYVGCGDLTWTELKKTRPTRRVLMRATAELADYFNYEFMDRSRLTCWKLTSPDGLHQLYAYAEAGSSAALSSALYAARGQLKMTVRVSYLPNSQSAECVKLEEILQPRWLMTGELTK